MEAEVAVVVVGHQGVVVGLLEVVVEVPDYLVGVEMGKPDIVMPAGIKQAYSIHLKAPPHMEEPSDKRSGDR